MERGFFSLTKGWDMIMRERHGLFHNSLVFILVFLLGVTVIVVPRWGLSVRTFDACFYCCCYCVFRGSVQEEKRIGFSSPSFVSYALPCGTVCFVLLVITNGGEEWEGCKLSHCVYIYCF